MIIRNGTVLDGSFKFNNKDVFVQNGIISDSCDDSFTLDCTDCYVLPGFIDIHTHGAMGFDHLDANENSEEIISRYMLKNGVTSYLATVMTQSHEAMSDAIKCIKKYRSEAHCGAEIAGIYLEGPYFSQEFRGAQNPDYIRKPDFNEFLRFVKDSGHCIKAVSLAPETENALDFINQAKSICSVAIGHTAADYDTAMNAVDCGASIFTHTFNAMSGLHHRNPGTVGASFDTDAYCECICDGIHIHPAVIRTLFKLKGSDRIIMISDSIRPAGLADGKYTSGGQNITVKDGKAFLDGGVIAGSTTNLLQGIRSVVKFGIGLEAAVKSASANPAKAVGIYDRVGSIESGKSANITVLDKSLNLKYVILNGKLQEI